MILGFYLLVVLFWTNGWALICPEATSDKLLLQEGTCFSFQERTGNGEMSFDDAAASCLKLGKSLASASSPEEQSFLVAELSKISWPSAAIAPRYRQSAWKWIADGTLLRGQGCYQNSADALSDSKAPSFASENGVSLRKCLPFCTTNGDHLFAALQNGRFCLCSSDEFFWQTPVSDCSAMFTSYVYATAEDAYDNWQPGRPSIGGECAAIAIDHKTNQWIDASCNLALPFICKFRGRRGANNGGGGGNNKMKQARLMMDFSPVAAERVACSSSACYHYYSNPQMTWLDADKFCAKYGGRLAKIESPERQELINTMLYDLEEASPDNAAAFTIDMHPAKLAWIGATNHFWFDAKNRTLVASYRNWMSTNQPEIPDAKSCTILATEKEESNGWQTANCNSLQEVENRFICVGQAVND